MSHPAVPLQLSQPQLAPGAGAGLAGSPIASPTLDANAPNFAAMMEAQPSTLTTGTDTGKNTGPIVQMKGLSDMVGLPAQPPALADVADMDVQGLQVTIASDQDSLSGAVDQLVAPDQFASRSDASFAALATATGVLVTRVDPSEAASDAPTDEDAAEIYPVPPQLRRAIIAMEDGEPMTGALDGEEAEAESLPDAEGLALLTAEITDDLQAQAVQPDVVATQSGGSTSDLIRSQTRGPDPKSSAAQMVQPPAPPLNASASEAVAATESVTAEDAATLPKFQVLSLREDLRNSTLTGSAKATDTPIGEELSDALSPDTPVDDFATTAARPMQKDALTPATAAPAQAQNATAMTEPLTAEVIQNAQAAPSELTPMTASQTQTLHSSSPVLPRQMLMSDPNWPAELSSMMEEARDMTQGEIEIALQPERLGRMTIKLEMRDAAVAVTIVTENEAAAQAFNEGAGKLSELMSKAGMELSQHSATTGSFARDTGQGAAQGQGQQNASSSDPQGQGRGQSGSSGSVFSDAEFQSGPDGAQISSSSADTSVDIIA